MTRKEKIDLLNRLNKGEATIQDLKETHYELTYNQDGSYIATVNGVVVEKDNFGLGFINRLFLDMHYGRPHTANLNTWTGKTN